MVPRSTLSSISLIAHTFACFLCWINNIILLKHVGYRENAATTSASQWIQFGTVRLVSTLTCRTSRTTLTSLSARRRLLKIFDSH